MNTVIIVLVVAIVSAALLRAGRKPAAFEVTTQSHILKYNGFFSVLGWLCGVVPAVGIGVLATIWPPKDQGEWIAVLGMIAGFGGLGAALINEGRAQIRLSADGIRTMSPWRGAIDISWEMVRHVHYSRSAQWFVIKDKAGQVIRAHNYMVGIDSLLAYFQDQLDSDLYQEAKATYESIMRKAL